MTRIARSLLARAFAVLSLIALVNIAAAPLAHAVAPPSLSVEQIAADLQATFGDVARLCADDDGSTPNTPLHHHGDCPLCCLHAAAAALVPPDIEMLPARRIVAEVVAFTPRDFSPPPPARASPAQPRAPPAQS